MASEINDNMFQINENYYILLPQFAILTVWKPHPNNESRQPNLKSIWPVHQMLAAVVKEKPSLNILIVWSA